MKIRLDNKDKVVLAAAGVVVYTIGLLPSAIIGGGLYTYRKQLQNYIIKMKLIEKVQNFTSLFK